MEKITSEELIKRLESGETGQWSDSPFFITVRKDGDDFYYSTDYVCCDGDCGNDEWDLFDTLDDFIKNIKKHYCSPCGPFEWTKCDE